MARSYYSIGELFMHATIIALPCVIFVLLVLYHLAPSGVFIVSTKTLERSPWVNRLLPEERAPASEDGDFVTIVDEPVYFSAKVPEGFETVDVTLEYRNHGQTIFELGALTDIFAQSYDLRPLENMLIDALDWHRVENAEHTLYERTATFPSYEDFLTELPERSHIATYHDELAVPYRDPFYAPREAIASFSVSLRGHHAFVTYVKDETLNATISFMDMNRTAGSDGAAIRVWNEENEVVFEERIEDDGNTTDNQVSTPLIVHTVVVPQLPEGVYRVELSGTSDIFWRNITTTQRYVTFVNRVYVGDDVGYRDGDHSTVFVTNAKHMVFETFHADSAEEVVLGDIAVQLPTPHEKVRYTIPETGLVDGVVPRGDIKMTGDGLFAFSREAFFNPFPVRMTVYTDLDASEIDYVLTTYTPSEALPDGWRSASATFDLANIFHPDGTATFLLSAPGIAERDAVVDIRRVVLRYHKPQPTLRDMLRELRDWFLR